MKPRSLRKKPATSGKLAIQKTELPPFALPSQKPERMPFVEIEREPHGTSYYSNESGKELFVTNAGRELIAEFRKKYGASLLRGDIPFEKRLIKQGGFGKIFVIEIDGTKYALKEYLDRIFSESGSIQSFSTAKVNPIEHPQGKIRAIKSYLGSDKVHLMELLEAPTLGAVISGQAGSELKKLYEEKLEGTDIIKKLIEVSKELGVPSYFTSTLVVYNKQTGKFEFVIVDI